MENDVDVIRGQKYFKKRIFCLACKPIKFSVNYRDYVTWDLSLVAGEVEPSVEFVVREGNCKKSRFDVGGRPFSSIMELHTCI